MLKTNSSLSRIHHRDETPSPTVQHMCDLCEPALSNLSKKVFEPGCGNGNFLVEVLERRLLEAPITPAVVLLILSNLYGIDTDPRRVAATRRRLRKIALDYLDQTPSDEIRSAITQILSRNIIVGDLLSDHDKNIFPEWTILENAKLSAQDFTLTEILHEAKQTFTLRPEQQSAVDQTFAYWQKHHDSPDAQFLWNAKPRFGKTLTAYKFAEKIRARRILIITNRPSVSDAWARDFFQYIAPNSEHLFASAQGGEIRIKNQKYHILSRKEIAAGHFSPNAPLIFFISLQDLKGKDNAGNFKSANEWLFRTKTAWDLLVIDESHEGIKTPKTSELLKSLNASFTLNLSGTPFRALADHDFSKEQIYNWTYLDEQKSQSESSHLAPQINLFTYNLPHLFPRCTPSNPHEFFHLQKGHFVHEPEIIRWLDYLAATIFKNNVDFPSDYFRHTFWRLSRVDECRALAQLLFVHPYFHDYEVIIAAGRDEFSGESRQIGPKLLRKVRSTISDVPSQTRTITLSCGRLTTGITIPTWTAVFMLYSSQDFSKSSSAQYWQTAFRAQNPCPNLFGAPKTKCYLFDFLPERALTNFYNYAANLCTDYASSKTAVAELLRFLPVQLIEDNDAPRLLTAPEILSLPRQLVSHEIVDGSFLSSDKLFHLDQIFHLSASAHQILNQICASKKHGIETTPEALPLPATKLNSSGEPLLSLEALERAASAVLSNVAYQNLSAEERSQVRTKISHPNSSEPTSPRVARALNEIRELARKDLRSHKKLEQDRYLEKLRGFARTVPFYLHLFGTPDLNLENFETVASDTDFYAITRLQKGDFDLLRHEGFFHTENFTAAIREFMRREQELSPYFLAPPEDYIFNYIPHQGKYVFTPPPLVEKILDYLEQAQPSIFSSAALRFFDPSSRSGLFLVGVVRRLFQKQRPDFSSDHDCLYHILTEQIFAWSPDTISLRSTLETVLSFVRFDPNFFSDAELAVIKRNFIIYNPADGKGIINHAEVIQKIHATWSDDMKFDIILGNPPYQSGRRQVYADFYRLAVDLDPEILCMIFPLGWQKVNNTNGLKQLNNAHYKRDPHLVLIDNYDEKHDPRLFPEINTGGVNIVLRNRSYDNRGKIQHLHAGQPAGIMTLPIKECETKKPPELTVLKPLLKAEPKIDRLGTARRPYGLGADPLRQPEKYQLHLQNDVQNPNDVRLFGLFANGERGYKYLPRHELPQQSSNLDHYKLFVPKAWGNMSPAVGLGGSYSNLCVARPGDACAETFIEFGPFASQDETIRIAKYFLTKFFRACLFLAKTSQNTARDKYRFVPLPDFSEDFWNLPIAELDEQLFEKYQVPAKTRTFILDNLQPRSEANIEIF